METPNYRLFIPDYNNGHETGYTVFAVHEPVFNLDWTEICNSIPTTRFTGLTASHVQDYMHKNNIYFIVLNTNFAGDVKHYVNGNDHNKKFYKIVNHHNIGNY